MLLVQHLIKGRPEPLVLGGQQSVKAAAQYLRDHQVGGAPVVDGKKLVGFVSERDLVFRVLAEGLSSDQTTVADVMSREVISAGPEDSVEQCEEKLRQAHCRHLPILDQGRLVACLSLRDFLKSDIQEAERELQQLKEYIRSAT